jgi:hypothetical protein
MVHPDAALRKNLDFIGCFFLQTLHDLAPKSIVLQIE